MKRNCKTETKKKKRKNANLNKNFTKEKKKLTGEKFSEGNKEKKTDYCFQKWQAKNARTAEKMNK